ncbi:MAG: HAD-IA family hydrolase [Coriobacteriia bacterium]|nr:HAD-IA family hydrolase [Coriobacteriia bacterium]
MDLILASARYATAVVLGEALPDHMLKHNVGIPLGQQMEEYAPGRSEELAAIYREHNATVHDELIREFPGTEDALEALRAAGYRLGVVTSKSVPGAWRGIDHFALGHFFETVVGFEDTSTHKPGAEPVLLAAMRLGVDPRCCVYVGDSPHDMSAGKAAGMLTVAALWGPFPERVLEPEPDYAIQAIGDLADLLGGNGKKYRVLG